MLAGGMTFLPTYPPVRLEGIEVKEDQEAPVIIPQLATSSWMQQQLVTGAFYQKRPRGVQVGRWDAKPVWTVPFATGQLYGCVPLAFRTVHGLFTIETNQHPFRIHNTSLTNG